MLTTITVASTVALILNKVQTGEFLKSKAPVREGTTIYTRLASKSQLDQVELSPKVSLSNREDKTVL